MRRLTEAIRRGLVLSCHDLSDGGLAVAAAEMALAGELGLEIELENAPADCTELEALLFGESTGRFLVEVPVDQSASFEALLVDLPYGDIGTIAANDRFVVRYRGRPVIDLAIAALDHAWKGSLAELASDHAARRQGSNDGSSATTDHISSPGSVISERPTPTRRPSPLSRRPRILVLAAAGVNCDRETLEACRAAGGAPEIVQLQQLMNGAHRLDDFGMVVLPGGFSYGDHLGAGSMLATIFRHRFLTQLLSMVADGRPILGICNGFQTLCRLGLLGPVGLATNASGLFDCRWVELDVHPSDCFFLDGLERIKLPIAHGEGRVVVASGDLQRIESRAPLRYVDNPNGSHSAIAGVCNETGNVFGLMPHPERATRREQHPGWNVREPAGLTIFRNAVRRAQGET